MKEAQVGSGSGLRLFIVVQLTGDGLTIQAPIPWDSRTDISGTAGGAM